MDTGTLATVLAVMRESSVRAAAALLGQPPSSVADAFERFESELALKLASRRDGGLSLTLAGENLARSIPALTEVLARIAKIAGEEPAEASRVLAWTAKNAIPVAVLGNFNAVIRAGSIRRAARELGVGQPNLSRQMAELERALRQKLLIREMHGCEPTPEGLEFSEAALALTTKVASLTGPARKRFARELRTVKLGTIIPVGHESRLAARLAALVAAWRADGKPELFVSSTTAEDLAEGLRTGRFDVALTDIALRNKRFESREIFSGELVIVGSADVVSPDAAIQPLVDRHLIAVPSLRSGLRQSVSEALEPFLGGEGHAAARLVEVDALSIVINLVLDHGYLTVLPLEAVAALDRPIGIIRLPDAPRVSFHLVWRRTQASRRIALQIAQSIGDA
ncbi:MULTISPECIES: LysR family transcriptional regulator [unclassified Mesorhizobium]|uniref:LysR family transcriptional regulator n=1 Tax=unclassified Mesorhizobium TaxID=325217 RepID=UPI001ABF55D8|nr:MULTISPECIES: LysR family transcriptional regulator [unclassified Mesorhizobium]